MMAFAEKVALNADHVTAADVDRLRSHGYRDEADSAFNDLDPALRQALTVGRPVADRTE
jgi:hypothetical protein